jgi:hypothetical protein
MEWNGNERKGNERNTVSRKFAISQYTGNLKLSDHSGISVLAETIFERHCFSETSLIRVKYNSA